MASGEFTEIVLVPVPSQTSAGAVGCVEMVGPCNTVKIALEALPPGVVTTTLPVVPVPTVTVKVSVVFETIVAAVPPIVTDDADDKFVPFIVKDEPTQPEAELKDVIVGGAIQEISRLKPAQALEKSEKYLTVNEPDVDVMVGTVIVVQVVPDP